jgi:hypothetical protein
MKGTMSLIGRAGQAWPQALGNTLVPASAAPAAMKLRLNMMASLWFKKRRNGFS